MSRLSRATYPYLLSMYQQRKAGHVGEGRTSLARAVCFSQLPYMVAENDYCDWGDAGGQAAVGQRWHQRMYRCSDGWIYVETGKTKAPMLAEIVSGNSDVKNKNLEADFAEHSCAEWIEKLLEADIGCHQVMNLNAILAEGVCKVDNSAAEETATGGLALQLRNDHPCGIAVTSLASSTVRIGPDHNYKRLKPAPRMGEHTQEILAELGYSENEIKELIRLKVAHEFVPFIGNKTDYFFRADKA